MGLRLAEGVDLADLSRRFSLPLADLRDEAKLAFYARQGLCWQRGSRIGVTDGGMPLLDGLLGELVPAGLLAA